MDQFPSPKQRQFTIYSKTGCTNCSRVKQFLEENNLLYTEVNCDLFLGEHKQSFLLFIQHLAGKQVNTFPMVFDHFHFIGGFQQTVDYCDKMMDIIF
jgi:glutaredoxin